MDTQTQMQTQTQTQTLNVSLPCPDLTLEADYVQLQKMVFLCNAIEQGWTVRKQHDRYIFVKKHENKREVYLDSYLRTFLAQNMDTRIFQQPKEA